ncbi:MAG: glycosyltransferase [Bacteroidetes bacterium]|nr:glycosyltransferase [Bacteroidota bacterium]
MTAIDKIINQCPKFVDLTNTAHLKLVNVVTQQLLEEYGSIKKINEIEEALICKKEESLTFILLALKIAKSKLIIREINEPVTISVVFAVYKEHNRIKKNTEHPHGEDFLRRKVLQLERLFENQPNFNWELIVVDDGCPENSGKIAQNIIEENRWGEKVEVLFLEDAIKQQLPVIQPLTSTRESQKGGAITYGMWHACQQDKEENHIVAFTDADLSTHLGQIGLLAEPILKQKMSVAIGSRRENTSVVIKKGTRNNRGKLFIYLWKRLLHPLNDIIDTQCGFKAFKKEMLVQIIDNLIERKFAFDIELLLKSELIQNNSIAKVPIAWIDSEEASTTTDIQPYLPMLKSIAKMYEKYLPKNPVADDFASFILGLNEEEFNKVLDNIPVEILEREPYEFSEYAGVSVSDLLIS